MLYQLPFPTLNELPLPGGKTLPVTRIVTAYCLGPLWIHHTLDEVDGLLIERADKYTVSAQSGHRIGIFTNLVVAARFARELIALRNQNHGLCDWTDEPLMSACKYAKNQYEGMDYSVEFRSHLQRMMARQ